MNIKELSILKRDNPTSALILAISLVVVFVLLAIFGIKGLKMQSGSTISSTGSARISVESDSARVMGAIERRVVQSNLQQGYSQLMIDKSKMEKLLNSLAVPKEAITYGSISTAEVWSPQNSGVREVDLIINFDIQSSDLELIQKVADKLGLLIEQGVYLRVGPIQYYYTKLPELRKKLLGEAVKDAKERAREIALNAGGDIGKIVSARAGVVQVLAPQSQDVLDYGSYDTSTKTKDVVVSVNAVFESK